MQEHVSLLKGLQRLIEGQQKVIHGQQEELKKLRAQLQQSGHTAGVASIAHQLSSFKSSALGDTSGIISKELPSRLYCLKWSNDRRTSPKVGTAESEF